jgi:exopolysaccharide production protein ExoZ
MLRNIQALRAIAAYLVVMSHAAGLLKVAGLGVRPIDIGAAGVDIFFVISGFIMVHTTRDRAVTPQSFMRNRIVRIVPLYWLVTFAVFAGAVVMPRMFNSTTGDIAELLKSLFFIPYLKGSANIQPVVYVGWTLNYEMFFYAIFALSLFFAQRRITIVIGALALLVALRPLAGSVVARFYTDPILLEFAAGMLLARNYDRLPAKGGAAVLALGVAALLSVPWVFPQLILWGPGAGEQGWIHRAWIYGIPAILIVGGALMLERQGRSTGRLLLLGNASYSIYLTHFFVVLASRKLFEAIGPSVPLAFVFLAATFVLVALVGIAVHLYVEKTAMDLINRAFKLRRPKLAAT